MNKMYIYQGSDKKCTYVYHGVQCNIGNDKRKKY